MLGAEAALIRLLRPRTESALARLDFVVVRRSKLNRLLADAELFANDDRLERRPPPEGAEGKLRWDHPRLLDLTTRYNGHPATAHSQWSNSYVQTGIDLSRFRADNAFVWQRRTTPAHYGLTTYYAREHDSLALFEQLSEDGLFGADVYDVDGLPVSRDLLDSVAELNFLEEQVGLSQSSLTVLDIGAGYGRLAHRITAAFGGVTCLCTDAVAVSTFLCEYYLRFRNAPRTRVVALDEIDTALDEQRVDFAINIHSFSECQSDVIAWWLDLLHRHKVSLLMVVPNTDDVLLTLEPDGQRQDFLPLIQSFGFELVLKRPKYAHSKFVQEHGIYPAHYFLFHRR